MVDDSERQGGPWSVLIDAIDGFKVDCELYDETVLTVSDIFKDGFA